MDFRGSFKAGGQADEADKEGLVKLGRALHSQAVNEAFARIITGVGGILGKLLPAGCRQREIKAQTGK